MTVNPNGNDLGVPPILADLLASMGVEVTTIVGTNDEPDMIDELRKLRHDNAPDVRSKDGTVNLDHTDIVDLLHALYWVHGDVKELVGTSEFLRAIALDQKIHALANKLLTVLDDGAPMTSVPF